MFKSVPVLMFSLLFVLAGVLTFVVRQTYQPQPMMPITNSAAWQMDIKVNFIPLKNPLQIDWQLPTDNSHYHVGKEFFITNGYGVEKEPNKPLSTRSSLWSKRYSLNSQTVFYRAIIQENNLNSHLSESLFEKLTEEHQARFQESRTATALKELMKDAQPTATATAIEELLDTVSTKTINRESFVKELFRALETDNLTTNELIQADIPRIHSSLEATWALANYHGIPTRIANGFKLSSQAHSHVPIVRWLEVGNKDTHQWVRIFPTQLQGEDSRDTFFALWYGKRDMLDVPNGLRENYAISIEPFKGDIYAASTTTHQKHIDSKNLYDVMDLKQLPIETSILLKTLLVFPVGALALAFIRQVIGIKIFGTFMPILLAISFRETGLFHGLLLVTIMVSTGLASRSLLSQLHLLFVPRISATMTLVIILITVMALFFKQINFDLGLSVFLFPIVIITMLIERISLMLDENGGKETVITGLGTVFVIVVCYFIMNHPQTIYFFFTFPEFLLVIVGLQILLGRYSGFRLTEYFRFQDLMKPKPPAP